MGVFRPRIFGHGTVRAVPVSQRAVQAVPELDSAAFGERGRIGGDEACRFLDSLGTDDEFGDLKSAGV